MLVHCCFLVFRHNGEYISLDLFFMGAPDCKHCKVQLILHISAMSNCAPFLQLQKWWTWAHLTANTMRCKWSCTFQWCQTVSPFCCCRNSEHGSPDKQTLWGASEVAYFSDVKLCPLFAVAETVNMGSPDSKLSTVQVILHISVMSNCAPFLLLQKWWTWAHLTANTVRCRWSSTCTWSTPSQSSSSLLMPQSWWLWTPWATSPPTTPHSARSFHFIPTPTACTALMHPRQSSSTSHAPGFCCEWCMKRSYATRCLSWTLWLAGRNTDWPVTSSTTTSTSLSWMRRKSLSWSAPLNLWVVALKEEEEEFVIRLRESLWLDWGGSLWLDWGRSLWLDWGRVCGYV